MINKTILRRVQTIFERFQYINPLPKIELHYTNHFTLLIAIVLSSRTTDRSVNKITKDLFNIVDSPKNMINLGQDMLKKYINSIGLYNSKAQNIMGLSIELVEQYNSIIPNDFDQLISLPGVGRKSANVFLNSAFNMLTIAVDTHVLRVSHRLGLVRETRNKLYIEQYLLKVIPVQYLLNAHNWLVLHGRYICKARHPLCTQCIIRDVCIFQYKKDHPI
ncbi:endonuclease III [Wolbachia endosymbiont of Howardula sp.]|uniref:endonuclease III n=1 Tax=Wolbachia endosymbiont of Howardula sp. TaxID=2916816 RepID=UPI00217EF715|nr:endonuclease III [Wolbachia endosymbiont of Howardula sp.]UWI83055.1 endonuclease III [Wolbachia endosymbiont of Howardula sp.]